MRIEIDAEELRPLVEQVAAELAARRASGETDKTGRLAFTEAEAASLLGVQRHVLRDARLRGELAGSRVGRKILYERYELNAYLERNRRLGQR